MSLVNSIKNTNEEIGQIDSQKPLTVPAQEHDQSQMVLVRRIILMNKSLHFIFITFYISLSTEKYPISVPNMHNPFFNYVPNSIVSKR